MIPEATRLEETRARRVHWRRWGPYLADRQWGTVREDYSAHGTAWDSFPHDHARSRVYRWGEDGILGISDNHQRLCFALALWNGRDPILKERYFGLTGSEGNHGEDVKEQYFYLDNTPTHSYMRGLYKYPQAEYPYARLVEESRRRDRRRPEFELIDTGAFDEGRYFDVAVEYAKAGPDDVLIRITGANRGPEAAELHLLPTLWFRNTWPWQARAAPPRPRPAPAPTGKPLGKGFDTIVERRRREGDEFYADVVPPRLSDDARNVMRQALAGMLWSKQWFHFDVRRWLEGDPAQPAPPAERKRGRNSEWTHLYNDDVVSMPDAWEYPWYAAWDLAFHTIPLALVDPDFGKEQLVLFLREWYMHPNGQIPAYEWAFGDVNPPVHAWAAWRVYKIDRRIRGVADREFLERVFHKLLLNFTWWVNRKDPDGKNVFQGGFLGLDNIGVFDRSAPLPTGGTIEQSDGTAWVGMYCLNMLAIALELARENSAYEDVASKFFEHFVYIAYAMNNIAGEGIELWNREDGFFYDVLHLPDGTARPLKIRSLVGLIPLFAVETLEPEMMEKLPQFGRRMMWFLRNRSELQHHVVRQDTPEGATRRLLSLVSGVRLASGLR